MYRILFEGTMFQMRTWNVCFIIGALFAFYLLFTKRPKNWITAKDAIIIFLILVCAGFIGAKFLFAFLHLSKDFQLSLVGSPGGIKTPIEIIFGKTGYAFLGAPMFQFPTVYIYCMFYKDRLNFLKVMDYVMPFTILQLAFVRVGCFFSGCCGGIEAPPPFGFFFPTRHGGTILKIPTQLYSSVGLIFIYIFWRNYYKKKEFKDGVVFLGSIASYSFYRFMIEFLRVDSPHILGPISVAQITLFTIGVVSLNYIRILNKKGTITINKEKNI